MYAFFGPPGKCLMCFDTSKCGKDLLVKMEVEVVVPAAQEKLWGPRGPLVLLHVNQGLLMEMTV